MPQRLWTSLVPALAALLLAAGAQARPHGLPDFTELVKRNGPAVVNISTTQKVRRPHPALPPGMDIPDLEGTPFGEWLKRFFGEEGGREFQARSLGSGFVISPDGYILTNYHVIKGADRIIVRLSDRRELDAKVVGKDERTDIALLKVESKRPLPTVRIGRSADLEVGEWVLAIGSPFGFDHSATAGIVSAKGRSLPSENYVPFIQTDVAINPGNSGGPLFNMDGEVVGINSQIYSRTGGYMGLSFAIPIDIAMEVVEQLRTKGKVTRGWLGVLIQDVDRDLAESFGLDKPEGALIAKVLPDSPAAKAGLRVGDIIVEYDGHPVPDSGSLPPLVGRTPVGKRVKIRIVRNGRPRTVTVRIGELPEDVGTGSATGRYEDTRLGLVVEALDEGARKELGVQGGVRVARVTGEPAREAGLRRGDVILMIDNRQVEDLDGYRRIVRHLRGGRSVPVLVQRGGGPMFLAVRVPEGK
ncbi:MAG TPA: DegQ family serine endoprotease [Chromatiales bacterium]|nr:DegQ family serine endoprotease [Chromatiales bacterium]